MTVLDDRPAVLGSTTPRLSTNPLVTGPPGPCGCGCALTPATSLGFQAIDFAVRVAGVELIPWQRWWLIHALELRSPGKFRFRTVVTLVGRQSGKTTLCKILALWMLYLGHAKLVLGVAQKLDIADESWNGAVEIAESVDDLYSEVAKVIRGNGKNCVTLASGARYRTTAATSSAGRGLSVDLLLLDEIREQHDWGAWGALSKTTLARPNALTVCTSNAGDDRSVVLNGLRSAALSATDDSVGLFEWSAPDGCELDDMSAVAQACPGLNYGAITESAVRSFLATDPPAVYRTEILCQHVEALDAAVDPASWAACADPSGSLAPVRDRIVLCLDVAPDGRHVTLAGAAPLDDGRVRVEVFGAWGSTDDARAGTKGAPSLAAILAQLKPRALGYFPTGPGAVFGVDLAELHGPVVGRLTVRKDGMHPYGPGVVELTGGTVPELCATFADLVQVRQVIHPDDPLLNAHVGGSQRHRLGDGWRFARKGAGHVDAAYALAGAVHLARSLPAPAPPPRIQVF